MIGGIRRRTAAATSGLLLAGMALVLPASATPAADAPLCRLATSDVDGYRGQISLREGPAGRQLAGYVIYRIPDDRIALQDMAFGGDVPVKLGLVIDFAIDAVRSPDALAMVERTGVSDLRLLVGRLEGGEGPDGRRIDLTRTMRLDVAVGTASGEMPYLPLPQSRIGIGTYAFGGGDAAAAQRIASDLLAARGDPRRQTVRIEVSSPAGRLETELPVRGFRAAAQRLLGGGDMLVQRAAAGRCVAVAAG